MKEKIIKILRWIVAAFIALMAVVGFPATIFFLLAAIVVAPIGVLDNFVIEKFGRWSKLKYFGVVFLCFAGIFSAPSTSSNNNFDPESLGDNYTIDYENSEAIETALNAGEDVNGKIVKFEVIEYHPDSSLGYNCFAGDHLNFISEENIDAESGDLIVAYINSKAGNILGSWKINYILLLHEKGKTLDEKMALKEENALIDEKLRSSSESQKAEKEKTTIEDKSKENNNVEEKTSIKATEDKQSEKKLDENLEEKKEAKKEDIKTDNKKQETKSDTSLNDVSQQNSTPATQKQSEVSAADAALVAAAAAQAAQLQAAQEQQALLAQQAAQQAVTQQVTQSAPAAGGMCWLSATGDKYHSINNCGRMNPNKATQISVSDAVSRGIPPCNKCW